jgi:hypothetical protein
MIRLVGYETIVDAEHGGAQIAGARHAAVPIFRFRTEGLMKCPARPWHVRHAAHLHCRQHARSGRTETPHQRRDDARAQIGACSALGTRPPDLRTKSAQIAACFRCRRKLAEQALTRRAGFAFCNDQLTVAARFSSGPVGYLIHDDCFARAG